MDFAVLQSERGVERAAVFRDESFENVAFTFREHFSHLIRRKFALENGLIHLKRAFFFWNVLTHIECANIVDLTGAADLACSQSGMLM